MTRFLVLVLLTSFYAFADEPTEISTLEVRDVLVDDLENAFAPKQVSKERLKSISTTDVARVLKESPGVYVREEDGVGLRPNIGLRGTNPDRSKKVVILEDSILIGPAPYSAPAAYFIPSLMTSESLEVYKGFAALPYGPNSIGGAINYKTNQFGPQDKNSAELYYGSFNTGILKLISQKKISDWNFLLNYGRVQSDGFKMIDSNAKTGFDQNHVLFKIQKPTQIAGQTHVFEARLGYANEDSKETYLGISEKDFKRNYLRRYNSTEKDEMKWTHTKIQLEHFVELNPNANLKNTLYRHDFARVWYRLDGFRDATKTLRDVLKNPDGVNLPFYEVLAGETDSAAIGSSADLVIANNNRKYFSQGFQSQLELTDMWSNSVKSKTQFKLLIHQDQIRREHDADKYSMTGNMMVSTGEARQATARNQEGATAASFSYQDELNLNSWIFNPQFRFESVKFNFKDDLSNTQKDRSDQVFLPGLGATYKLIDRLSVKASVNKGATLSGLDSSGQESREESINKEIGLVWNSKERQEQVDILLFQNDYSNITGTCTTSTGCGTSQLDQQYDGGKATVAGVEARVSKGFEWATFWIPTQINYSVINANFAQSFNSTNAEWGVGQIQSGDPLPYVPQTQLAIILGLEKGRWKQSLILNHFGRMYDQSVAAGQVEIPAYGVADYTLQFQLQKTTSLKLKVDNIFNKRYVTSLRPFGYRPGKPQTFSLGIAADF